jgi:hypothetical protein
MKHIVQMERKVERQMEKEVGNQMIDNKVPLDVWNRRQLRIYGTCRNINRLDDERIKSEITRGHICNKTDSMTATTRISGRRNNLNLGSPDYSGSPDTQSKRSATMCPIHNKLEHHYQDYQDHNHDDA